MPDQDLTWGDPTLDGEFENFIGRADKLNVFRENFLGERPRWMALSVTGEGGVGKTTLLRQFIRMAETGEIEASMLYCDDRQMTPADLMGFVAHELHNKFNVINREFDDHYSKYCKQREQADKDPNAPDGLLDLGVHLAADVAADGLSRVPGLGSMGSEKAKADAGDVISKAAQYFFPRSSKKESESEQTLIPPFIQLLNEAASQKRLVILLDVFEQTGRPLSPWLLDLFTAHYQEISARVSFVISGRDPLEQHWTALGKRLVRLALEPFELKETREYLINRNITDETLIEQIHRDTAGLPVLVELLAATDPQPGRPLPDISKNAVDRFLQWTPADRREIALLAAIPRQFNQDILAILLGADAPRLFEWLSERGYIRSDSQRGWFYHEKVRELMLRYQKNRSPDELEKKHGLLADHFAKCQAELNLEQRKAYQSPAWRSLELERIYHRASTAPEQSGEDVLNSFLAAFLYHWRFAGEVVRSIQQVAQDGHVAPLETLATRLDSLITAYEKDEYQQVISILDNLASSHNLNTVSKIACFYHRGVTYGQMGQYEQALQDFDRAIQLDDKYAWAIANRGVTYRLMGQYEQALQDFDRAIQLDDKNASVIANRGETYRRMGQYEQALQDFDHAIQLDDKSAWIIRQRGITYRALKNYPKALDDINLAITLEPNSYSYYYSRAETYRLMGNYREAIADFTEALKEDEPDIATYAHRAAAYRAIGDSKACQDDLEKALSMECKDEGDHYSRGTALVLAGRIPEALAELEIAFVDLSCRVDALTDDLLDPVRDVPEFKTLLAKYD